MRKTTAVNLVTGVLLLAVCGQCHSEKNAIDRSVRRHRDKLLKQQ